MHLIKKKKKKVGRLETTEAKAEKYKQVCLVFFNYRQDVLLQANTDDIVACHLFAFFLWFVIYIQHRG